MLQAIQSVTALYCHLVVSTSNSDLPRPYQPQTSEAGVRVGIGDRGVVSTSNLSQLDIVTALYCHFTVSVHSIQSLYISIRLLQRYLAPYGFTI